MVEQITSMEEDFAQWYTDVVLKAELIGYTSVKGCMAIKPAGYAIWLKRLSIANGHTSLIATSAHRKHIIFLGTFFRNILNTTTARINQLADMLI